jgi:hypothetical protein
LIPTLTSQHLQSLAFLLCSCILSEVSTTTKLVGQLIKQATEFAPIGLRQCPDGPFHMLRQGVAVLLLPEPSFRRDEYPSQSAVDVVGLPADAAIFFESPQDHAHPWPREMQDVGQLAG